MSRTFRVVLDTSVLVSAALRIGSTSHRALLQAFGSSEVCASAETLAELERVLQRDKFDRYLDRESRRAFVELIRRNSRLFPIQDADLSLVQPPCRDPEDDKFLALALVAESDALVSSDEDLLVLHPWRGIRIVTPAEYLRETASEIEQDG